MATIGFTCLPIIVCVVMMFYEHERRRELWRWTRDALRKWTKTIKIVIPAIIQLEALWVRLCDTVDGTRRVGTSVGTAQVE